MNFHVVSIFFCVLFFENYTVQRRHSQHACVLVGGTRKIRITTLTRVEFSTRSSTRLGRKETVNLSASSTSSKKV
jgi:hypothetical protein